MKNGLNTAIADRRVVNIASIMYDAHDALSGLFGDQFHTKLKPWMDGLRCVMRARNCGAVEACVACCRNLNARGQLSPEITILLLAATVEIQEPADHV